MNVVAFIALLVGIELIIDKRLAHWKLWERTALIGAVMVVLAFALHISL